MLTSLKTPSGIFTVLSELYNVEMEQFVTYDIIDLYLFV